MSQNLRNLIIALVFIYYLSFGVQHLQAEETFQEEDHCLAYQTEETILLFIDSVVFGKTCEISTQIESVASNTRFLVSFPIKSLDTGLNIRDEDVTEMLSVKSNTDIRFISDFLTEEEVSTALNQGKTKLGGMLDVAGKSYKVIFPLILSEHSGTWLVTGKLVTSLTELGLELPSVLGGVVADTRDYLELLVHLRFNLVQGLPELHQKSMNLSCFKIVRSDKYPFFYTSDYFFKFPQSAIYCIIMPYFQKIKKIQL